MFSESGTAFAIPDGVVSRTLPTQKRPGLGPWAHGGKALVRLQVTVTWPTTPAV